MKKRILSFVVVLVLVVGFMPTIIFADTNTSGTCGETVTWSFDSSTGTLTIDGTGKMKNYSVYDSVPWHTFKKDIIKVVLNNGVTSIGSSAFFNCSSLSSITISDSITSLGDSAFANCCNLISAIIPDGVISIGSSAFSNCTALTSVTIPDTVTSIDEHAFYECSNLKKVYISDIAAWCEIDFENFYSTPLCNFADLYLNNTLVTKLEIPNRVTSISAYAFNKCTSITSVIIPDSVTSIGEYAFLRCYNMKKASLTSGITTINEGTFGSCGIEAIYIPKEITLIEFAAFDYSSHLKYVYYGGSEADKNNLTILTNNDPLNSATWIYNATGLPECKYDNSCDTDCNFCGETREITHRYGAYTSDNNATTEKDGTKTRVCSVCGNKDTMADIGTKLIIKNTAKIFTDIGSAKWYKEYVDYAYTYGFFKGMTDTTFEPNTALTRGMFVTVLSRISGEEISNDVTTKFKDVAKGKWYTGPIKWANENGIVKGLSETTFGCDNKITREQMCTMIMRFANFKNITLEITSAKTEFADDSSISDWAKEAVYACQRANIVNGSVEGGKTLFKPRGNATRAEASKILSIFHKDYLA